MKQYRSPLLCAVLATLAAPAAARVHDDEALFAELRALVRGWDTKESPGGVLGVVKRGEPWFVHAFGMADLAAGRPLTPSTPMYLASTAKQFTAACLLHAEAAGRLSLADPITKHVPGLPQAWSQVTLRNLASHRSGVKDVYEVAIGLDLGPGALQSNETALTLLRQLPELDFAPDSTWRYSNSGYVLLAEALRAATGKSLGEYAREHLFGPLAMTRTGYGNEPAAATRARSHRRAVEGWKPTEVVTGLTGPGGLWASCEDLVRWERAWQQGKVVGAPVMVQPATVGTGKPPHPVFGPYGMGLMIGAYRGMPTVRHGGGAFGWSAEILRFPGAGLTVIALANASDLSAMDLAQKAADAVLGDRLAPKAATSRKAPDQATLARFGRMWRDMDSGIAWILTLRSGRPVVATLGDLKTELEWDGGSQLVAVGTQVPMVLAFEPAAGPATRMVVRVGGEVAAECRPMSFPPRDLPDLATYAGEYAHAGTESRLRIRATSGRLEIVQERPILPTAPFVVPPFHPLGEDVFVSDAGAQLTFHRGKDGAIDQVRMDTQRARGLVLTRGE